MSSTMIPDSHPQPSAAYDGGSGRPPREGFVRPVPAPLPAVSWGAVFSGFVLSLVVYLFLSILGAAIGATAVNPTGDANPLSGFGTGAGIWLLLTTALSIFAGALVAGRSAPTQGGLHGLLSWSVTTLVTTFLLASLASGIVGQAFGIVGRGLSLAGQGVAAASPGIASELGDQLKKNGVDVDWKDLRGELDTLLKQSGKAELAPDALTDKAKSAGADGEQAAKQAAQDPAQSDEALSAWFDRVRSEGRTTLDAADRDALVNIVAARTGKSRAEAEQIVANYQQQWQATMAKLDTLKQQAEQKAREAGDAAAKGVSRAAWTAVVVLIIGAAIGWFAGALGFRRRRAVIVTG